MSHTKKLPHPTLGFLLAPLLGIITQLICTISLVFFLIPGKWLLISAITLTYLSTVLLFWPQHILLERSQSQTYAQYALIGLNAGLITALLLAFFSSLFMPSSFIPTSNPFLKDFIMFCYFSLPPNIITALLFRFIAGCHFGFKNSSNKNKNGYSQRDQDYILYFE